MASFNFLKTDYQLKQLKNKFSTVWYAGKINGYWCTVNFDTKECSITIGAHKDGEHKSLVQLLRGEGICELLTTNTLRVLESRAS